MRNDLTRIIFSIDGSTPEVHQSVCGAAGTFAKTLRAIRIAEVVGLKIEINTLITRQNVDDLTAIADLIRPMRIARWNLYFLVPMIAASRAEMLSAEQAEEVFATIDAIRGRETFAVRVVEAPSTGAIACSATSMRASRTLMPGPTSAGYENHDGGDLMDSRARWRARLRLHLPRRRRPRQRVSSAERRQSPLSTARIDLPQQRSLRRAARSQQPAGQVRPLRVSPHLRRLARPGVDRRRQRLRRRSALRVRARRGHAAACDAYSAEARKKRPS